MHAILFSLLPWTAAVMAAGLSLYTGMERKLQPYVQHLAAGVVFSAVAVELVPDIVRRGRIPATLAGFGAAVLLLLLVRHLGHRRSAPRGKLSYSAAVFADNLVDGLIIAVGYSQGEHQGTLLLIAVAVEFASVGASLPGQLAKTFSGRPQVLFAAALITGSVVAGSAIGYFALRAASESVFAGVLAFAAGAFLYLVAVELLREAHKLEHSEPAASMFFAGFLFLLMIRLVQR